MSRWKGWGSILGRREVGGDEPTGGKVANEEGRELGWREVGGGGPVVQKVAEE